MDTIRRIGDRTFKGNDLRITYSMAFNLLQAGQDAEEIKKQLNITTKCLDKAKAAYLSLFPEEASKLYPIPNNRRKILIDECVSPRSILSIAPKFGWATHVDYLGMAGTKDPDLYRYALEQGYSAIFTADLAEKKRSNPFKSKDLTVISTAYAIEAVFDEETGGKLKTKRLPVIVRLGNAAKSYRTMNNQIERNAHKIEFVLNYKPSPYVTITNHGITMGPSHKQIFDEFFSPIEIGAEFNRRSRIEAWTDGWVKKIINRHGNQKLSKSKMKELRDLAAANAAACVYKF